MKFVDSAPVTGIRFTSDGYMVAEVRTARTGIQDYAGYEVGQPEKAVVKVYRPEAEVFDKASLGSYAHRPVTNDHPHEAVTADNWSQFAVGQIGDEVLRDGEFVKVPLIVMDASAIKAIQSGKRELSAGYTCDLAFEPGVTPDGIAYDAVQRDIKINHVAIVQHGRAGSEARIGDSAKKWGVTPICSTDQRPEKEKIMTLKTVTVDGIPVETTDAGATVIAALQSRLSDSASKMAKLVSDHEAAISALNSELAAKDAQIDSLNDKVLDAAALDAAVIARSDLLAKARSITPDGKFEGLSDAEIRKAVVVAKLGDAMATKDASYINARFDILAEDSAGADDFRMIVASATPVVDSKAASRASYLDRMTRR